MEQVSYRTELRKQPERSTSWSLIVVRSPGREIRSPRPYRLSEPLVRIDRVTSAQGNAIVLDDPAASQGMVTLRLAPNGRYEVEDAGSRNPVRLNGAPIRRAELNANDVLRIGDSLLVVDRDDSARSASTRGGPVTSRVVDGLARRLRLYDATVSCLLRVDAALLTAEHRCLLVWTPGTIESLAFGEWLAETRGYTLQFIEAVRPDAPARMTGASPHEVVLVDRLDFASQSGQLEIADATRRRLQRPVRTLTVLTVDHSLRANPPPLLTQLLPPLSEYEIAIPALHQRKADVLRAICDEASELTGCQPPGGSVDVCEHLLCSNWPGGLAELRRTARWLHGMSQLQDGGAAAVLPPPVRDVAVEQRADAGAQITPESVLDALDEHDGNMSSVAEHFGMSRSWFYKRLREVGIDIDQLRKARKRRKPGT